MNFLREITWAWRQFSKNAENREPKNFTEWISIGLMLTVMFSILFGLILIPIAKWAKAALL